MSDDEKPSWEWRNEVARLREQLATVTEERDALKRERREYGMALTQEELRDPESRQGYCEDFGVDYHRDVQARVNLEQQLAAMTAEREEARDMAACLLYPGPTFPADVAWAEMQIAKMKQEKGLP